MIAALICAAGLSRPHANAADRKEGAELVQEITARVARVVASGSGSLVTGSAVIVAEGQAVTNCHVVLGAEEILVSAVARTFQAKVLVADPYLDICLLSVPQLPARELSRRGSEGVVRGEQTYAVGFAQGRLGFSRGKIIARYPMRGAHVLRTSAGFLTGASGGGLFDDHGRLIGMLTFYRQSAAGSLYVAVPVEWIDRVIGRAGGGSTEPSDAARRIPPFWDIDPDRADPERPRFMQAMALESAGRWAELEDFARSWSAAAPDDEGARATMDLLRQRARH